MIRVVILLFVSVSGLYGQPLPRPLSLQQALRDARLRNPVLLAAQFDIQATQADVVTAGLRPNPLLNNQTLQLVRPSRFTEGTGALNNQNRQVWWQLTSPVNVAQQRQKGVALAEQTVELSRRNVAEAERNLLLDVANNWLDAWNARRSIELVAQAQRTLDTLVIINQVRLRNQVITRTDLLRTQLLADQYRLRSQVTQQQYLNQLVRLKRLLASPDSLDIPPTDDLTFWSPGDTLIDGARRYRADVRLAEQAVEVAHRNTTLQEALRVPRPELGAIYNPQNSVPYVGFFGTFPLPFFNKNQGNIQRAKILEQQTQQVVTYTRQQVQVEVQTAYRTYQTQQNNLNRYANIINQSNQILSSVRYAYLKGGTTIVDFLEAQRSWLDVQQEYLNTQTEFRRALIQLLFASGQIQEIAK